MRLYLFTSCCILMKSNTNNNDDDADDDNDNNNINYFNRNGELVVIAFALCAGGRWFNPRPRHTKYVIKMVPDAFLLDAQHIRSGFSLL